MIAWPIGRNYESNQMTMGEFTETGFSFEVKWNFDQVIFLYNDEYEETEIGPAGRLIEDLQVECDRINLKFSKFKTLDSVEFLGVLDAFSRSPCKPILHLSFHGSKRRVFFFPQIARLVGANSRQRSGH